MRRILAVLGVGSALLFTAAPALAHDCFNPNKPADAGVHYLITAFDPTTGAPTLEQVTQGKGIGGFVEIAPEVIGNTDTVEAHTIGNSSSHEVVGIANSQAPESVQASHVCDGKGIDYLDACGLAAG
jgi:hypothetical protein